MKWFSDISDVSDTSIIYLHRAHVEFRKAINGLVAIIQSETVLSPYQAVLARAHLGGWKTFVGQHCWARRYFVATVGRDERVTRATMRDQEQESRQIDQARRCNISTGEFKDL